MYETYFISISAMSEGTSLLKVKISLCSLLCVLVVSVLNLKLETFEEGILYCSQE